jgi:DnaJ-class molecular chaperone
MSIDDHYAVLGLTPTAGVGEIRRAFRLLALRHHPDRAGPDATALFQRITEAYRVLSNPSDRSIYDAERPSPHRGGVGAAASTGATATAPGPTAAPVRPTEELILRLCGALDVLEARRVVRVQPNGHIELYVMAHEARAGGVAAIRMPLTVPCPTCGGIAGPNGVWCRRCQFAGSIVEEVTLCVPIPEHAPDGLTFNVELERLGDLPPLTVRIRVG